MNLPNPSPSLEECPICLMEFSHRSSQFTTRCNHSFHLSCLIDSAFSSQQIQEGSNSSSSLLSRYICQTRCPICRACLPDVKPLLNLSQFNKICTADSNIRPKREFDFGRSLDFLNRRTNPVMDRSHSYSVLPIATRKRRPMSRFVNCPPIVRDEILRGSLIESMNLYNTENLLSENKILSAKFEMEDGNNPVMITESSPSYLNGMLSLNALKQEGKRPGVDLVCIVDRSGSMASDNKMDLLKMTLQHICLHLDETDRLAIISFDWEPFLVSHLACMDTQTREDLAARIPTHPFLEPSYGTNIIGALNYAVKMLKERTQRNAVTSILLLTDGIDGFSDRSVPYVEPLLRGLKDCSIHTFGFGRDHDSSLLTTISEICNGTFTFINKLDMVETAFAICLSGILSISAKSIQIELTLSPESNFVVDEIMTSYRNEVFSDQMNRRTKAVIYIPDIYQEESRHILFRLQQHTPKQDYDTCPAQADFTIISS
eukprot:TRINITY_DN2283_c0_g2_i1.p1 TRINITY_DN2283_c0_g2~~TRINITY_DN2283_c0_g2_i1.p1  ORF type:complete len:498 (+),score=81.30 TRINITY_DN2283_c0_g2_i1:35-1495(+)